MPALSEIGSWVHSNLEVNTLGRCLPQPPAMNEDGEEVEDPDAPEPSPVLRSVEEEEGECLLFAVSPVLVLLCPRPVCALAEGGGEYNVDGFRYLWCLRPPTPPPQYMCRDLSCVPLLLVVVVVVLRFLLLLRLLLPGDWNLRVVPSAGRVEGAEGGLAVVRSLRWPGACTVGFGKRFANVYVGYGHRFAAAAYAPPAPADVQGEFDVTAMAEEATFQEGVDVTEDPDAGVPAGDGEEEEDE